MKVMNRSFADDGAPLRTQCTALVEHPCPQAAPCESSHAKCKSVDPFATCVEIKFLGIRLNHNLHAIDAAPALDGVAVPFPRRSTESARQRSRRDFVKSYPTHCSIFAQLATSKTWVTF